MDVTVRAKYKQSQAELSKFRRQSARRESRNQPPHKHTQPHTHTHLRTRMHTQTGHPRTFSDPTKDAKHRRHYNVELKHPTSTLFLKRLSHDKVISSDVKCKYENVGRDLKYCAAKVLGMLCVCYHICKQRYHRWLCSYASLLGVSVYTYA